MTNNLIISPEVQNLIENYLTAPNLTEREKAELETKVWLGIPSNGDSNPVRRAKVASLLNIKVSHFIKRYEINYHPNKEVVNLIWDKVEKGDPCMGLGPALILIRESKDRATENGKNQVEVLKTLIESYDRRQVIVVDGVKVYKKGRPFMASVDSAYTESQEAKAENHESLDLLPEVTGSGTTSSKTFWFIIKKAIITHLKHVVSEGGEPLRLNQMIEEFEVDIKVAIEEFQSKVRSERTFAKTRSLGAEISRREIIKACQSLNMEPPEVGRPIDLKKAKKQKKILASAYHPDKTGNDSSDLVRQVFEQYEKVEKYADKYGQV